jgi:cytosolic carboxypeptidase protein 5
LYFHREVLTRSLEGWPIEMLTVSLKSGISNEQPAGGDKVPYSNEILYPEGKDGPLKFDKKTLHISSRVHCGETVASFILEGIFEFLTSEVSKV